jgi:CO dehydrogenase/acetyl-CoA synthase beta subunit
MGDSTVEKEFKDPGFLIKNIYDIILNSENKFLSFNYDDGKEADRLNIRKIGDKKQAYIVTAGDTGLELGSPKHKSVNSLIWTKKKNLIQNKIWITGDEFLSAGRGPIPFGMFLLVQVNSEFNPTTPNFLSLKNLSNKIPGYMSRSIPGKIWIRISKKLLSENFSLQSLAQSLIFTYRESIKDLAAIDVIIVSGNLEIISELEKINNSVRALSQENTNLQLDADGILSCTLIDCTSCDSKIVCDPIRDVIIHRKNK